MTVPAFEVVQSHQKQHFTQEGAAAYLSVPALTVRAFVERGFLQEKETASKRPYYVLGDLDAVKRQLLANGFYTLRHSPSLSLCRRAA